MVSIDITSARLVPAAGADGLLCRLPGAVVWLPASDQDGGELISAFLSARNPGELLGSVGSRLADPAAAPWPPFAILAARGLDLVVVVHGPVEVTVEQDGAETRLYGGDDIGSWLHRLLRGVSVVRAGATAGDESLVDLREGVIRAGGFALAAAGEPRQKKPADLSSARSAAAPRAVPEALTVADQPVQAVLADDATVVEADRPATSAGTGYGSSLSSPAVLGRLTWDNGEVHQLRGAVLVGRDVASDQAVLSGQVVALVPSGQNDSMSRVHAELRPRGGDIVVTDKGSTTGTFVWDEASKAWQRLVAGQPQALPGGAVLAFGERTATFQASGSSR